VSTADARAPVLGRIAPVRRDEVAALAWSFTYFFCLLAAYYMIRPVRDEMAVQAGAARLQWLFSATFITMVALIPVFGGLAARLPVKRLLPVVYGFFALNLAGFYAALESGTPLASVAPVFFVWVSVFNLFVVSVFWSFMADLYSTAAARRLFGFISAGGSLGAVTGPGLTAWLAPAIGIPNLLLGSATLLAAAIGCIVALLHLAPGGGARFLRTAEEETGTRPSLLEGVVRIGRSPYLAGICVFLVCYTLLSTLLYFAQTRLVPELVPTPERRTQLFAAVDLAVNALTLVLQILVTGRLLSKLGVTVMLAALPVVAIVGFLLFGLVTVLPVLVAFGVLRRAGEFAISKPARETLYTVVPREEKYQAKNVIDTVVHRGGDAASAWGVAGLQSLGLTLSGLAFAGVPIACLWLATALFLGRRHEQMRGHARAAGSVVGR
jgi:AAA family ATP:ADP antiporter